MIGIGTAQIETRAGTQGTAILYARQPLEIMVPQPEAAEYIGAFIPRQWLFNLHDDPETVYVLYARNLTSKMWQNASLEPWLEYMAYEVVCCEAYGGEQDEEGYTVGNVSIQHPEQMDDYGFPVFATAGTVLQAAEHHMALLIDTFLAGNFHPEDGTGSHDPDADMKALNVLREQAETLSDSGPYSPLKTPGTEVPLFGGPL